MDANAVEWTSVDHALRYLARADSLPHRVEGEAALLEHLPEPADRVLDIGTGDGRLLALVLAARPDATGVAVDFSPTMLDAAWSRFANANRVEVLEHDIGQTSASTTSTATGNGGSWPFLEDPCPQRQPPYRHADHDKERGPFGSRNVPERSCKASPNPNGQRPLIAGSVAMCAVLLERIRCLPRANG